MNTQKKAPDTSQTIEVKLPILQLYDEARYWRDGITADIFNRAYREQILQHVQKKYPDYSVTVESEEREDVHVNVWNFLFLHKQERELEEEISIEIDENLPPLLEGDTREIVRLAVISGGEEVARESLWTQVIGDTIPLRYQKKMRIALTQKNFSSDAIPALLVELRAQLANINRELSELASKIASTNENWQPNL